MILQILHKKINLTNLKTEVDKLDIEKLASIPLDLSRLSDIFQNDVVKKILYVKLVANVNNIDTSDFALKTKFQTDKGELEKKFLIWLALLWKENSMNL